MTCRAVSRQGSTAAPDRHRGQETALACSWIDGIRGLFTDDLNRRAAFNQSPAQLLPTTVRPGATIGANATIVCGHVVGDGTRRRLRGSARPDRWRRGPRRSRRSSVPSRRVNASMQERVPRGSRRCRTWTHAGSRSRRRGRSRSRRSGTSRPRGHRRGRGRPARRWPGASRGWPPTGDAGELRKLHGDAFRVECLGQILAEHGEPAIGRPSAST
jgi:hypothetical protein